MKRIGSQATLSSGNEMKLELIGVSCLKTPGPQ